MSKIIKENGYAIAKCVTCGAVAKQIPLSVYEQRGKEYCGLIHREYCDSCGYFWFMETRKNAQKDYRARNKIVKKQLKKRCSMLQEYAENLVAENMKLKHQLDMMR